MVARKSGPAGIVDSILLMNPIVAAFISLGGFVAIIISVIIGVGSFEYALQVDGKSINKQVGFVWAINWSISLVILMPLLVCFGLMSYRTFRRSLDSLVSKNMVSNQDGSRVTSDNLFDAWKGILVTIAIIVLLMIGVALAYAYWEYWEVVGRHFQNGFYPSISLRDPRQEMDWSVAALLPIADSEVNPVNKGANNIFSLIIYLLLPGLGTGITFGFFLFLIGFIWFLFRISDKFVFLPDLSDSDPRRGFQVFSETVENAIWATMIVFLICYLMIIQNLFLRDVAPSILEFVIPELNKGYKSIINHKFGEGLDAMSGLIALHPGGINLQAEFSFVIAILITVIILGFVILTLRHIARHCQERVIERLNSRLPVPSLAQDLDNNAQIDRARKMDYWPASWPTVNTLLLLVLGSVICIVFYKFGLVFVGIIIAYLVIKIVRRLRAGLI